MLLVVCDYFSNFMEVVRLSSIIFRVIIKELKVIFVRFGVLDILVIDNGS